MSDSRQLTVTICGINEDAEEYVLNHVRTVKRLMLPSQSITKKWLAQYSHFDDIPISTYENVTPQMIIGLEYSKPTTRAYINWSDFFSIENLGVKIPEKVLESKDVARANHILETTIKKNGNHYEVGLLWKTDDIELPNSYFMAKRRLECVESKMKKDPVLAQRMRAYIQDFIEKGYIRKLTEKERNLKGPRTWYLPIFPVFNPKKPEKLRVVWDGAAKVDGVSLNSVLLTGPDLLEPLPDVLRRFREKKIAYIGDLKEMFHQIEVAEPDQDSQRFLWHDDPENLEQDPDEYILTVDSFGLRCSPSTAQFVKNRNAENFKDKYPDATKAIVKGHYVDDMLENSHTIAEAAKLLQDVQFLVNANTECGNKSLEKDPKEIERVLGMYWNTKNDTFTYSLKLYFKNWRTRLGWDDEIPTSMKEKWIEWLQQLPMVEEVHVPRLFESNVTASSEINSTSYVRRRWHGSLCSCSVFRVEDDYGIDTCIVGAKSRVAPIKPMSVPRLELQELTLAESLIYRQVQYDSFQDELVIIRHNATAPIDKQKEFEKS
ncbi:uncharacterized protein LOC119083379, partial [Bradysia coprophila]|uniref:uncharacterized protein LOC119083379 n=1 Tax=Bradysia coprophila TaxID=38358 RepID=UPI00187D8100